MIFNKNNQGGSELRNLLGFIDSSTNFDRWKTWIELSVRQITAITGTALYTLIEAHYQSANYLAIPVEPTPPVEGETPPTPPDPSYEVLDGIVSRFQLANALFAYVKLLPSLDAGHGNSGRKREIGETERALTAVEAYKDETNILNLAYEAMESLIAYLDQHQIAQWVDSETKKSTAKLFVQNMETFNLYFMLNSQRMFYTIVPMLREIQRLQVTPAIGETRTTAMLAALTKAETLTEGQTLTEEEIALIDIAQNYIRRPLVLDTMATALERLNVELFPEGVLQTSIIGTVKEKRTATEEARKSMIASLRRDAQAQWVNLQNKISLLDDPTIDIYIRTPKESGAGFRF